LLVITALCLCTYSTYSTYSTNSNSLCTKNIPIITDNFFDYDYSRSVLYGGCNYMIENVYTYDYFDVFYNYTNPIKYEIYQSYMYIGGCNGTECNKRFYINATDGVVVAMLSTFDGLNATALRFHIQSHGQETNATYVVPVINYVEDQFHSSNTGFFFSFPFTSSFNMLFSSVNTTEIEIMYPNSQYGKYFVNFFKETFYMNYVLDNDNIYIYIANNDQYENIIHQIIVL